MGLKFSFEVDPVGMTVPYSPLTDEIRRNRGFVDLRNEPGRAAEIAEATNSQALRTLLVNVAQPGCPVFTIGCDLGSHREPTNVPVRRREVAGGYLQFASIRYTSTEPQAYSAFANAIAKDIKSRVGQSYWELQCIGKWVDFKFDGEPHGLRPSLWVWFFAASDTPLNALRSREQLIEAIDRAVAMPTTAEIFSAGRNEGEGQ